MKEERNKTLQQQTTDKYHRFQVVTLRHLLSQQFTIVEKPEAETSNYMPL